MGPKGRLIVTTRDSSLLTAVGAEELALDVLVPEAALQLLAQWSGVSLQNLPQEAEALAKECGRLPLALTLAGAQVRDGKTWADLLTALQAGKLSYLDHPYGSVFSSMQLSLDVLSETQRARLLELAVFPEDIAIPETTIGRYWAYTGGLADYETRALLNELKNKGLLYLKEKDGESYIEFHDLQRDFLILSVEAIGPLHQALLDAHMAAYNQTGEPWYWWKLPEDEPYLWDHLVLHLHASDRTEAIRQLLCDYNWLRAKLEARGLNGLLNDFEGFPRQEPLGLIAEALRLSAHVLKKAPEQMVPQLLSRLMTLEQQEIRQLIESIRLAAPECWLALQRPTLTPPGGPLLRTLAGHSNWVSAVAITPDGRRAVSASNDHSLKVWDLQSGEQLNDLAGHSDWVRAVALTPDGRRAVSASNDHSLKVWDLQSGNLITEFYADAAMSCVAVTQSGDLIVAGDALAGCIFCVWRVVIFNM